MTCNNRVCACEVVPELEQPHGCNTIAAEEPQRHVMTSIDKQVREQQQQSTSERNDITVSASAVDQPNNELHVTLQEIL